MSILILWSLRLVDGVKNDSQRVKILPHFFITLSQSSYVSKLRALLSFSLTPNHGHCKHTCVVQNDEWQLCAHFNSLLCTIVVVLDNNYDEVLVRKIQGKILLSQI